MSELSDYLENAILNLTLNGTAFTAVATPYLALFTADPTDAGTGAEATWTGYARQSMSFATASGTGGSISTDAAITFPATDASVTITHFGIMDAATNGNLLYHTPLDASKALSSADVISFDSGNITVTLA